MRSQQPQKSPATLATLAFCMALQMTGFVMILPLFARRFESFGAGVDALGASAMAYALTTTICAPFMGLFADRYGRRPIILLSISAYAIAFGGYLLAASAWLFILIRGLAGVFTAGLIPAINSAVGDLATEDRRAQWIGIVSGGAAAGWVVGPLFGGLLYDRFGYVVPFAVSIAMELGALLLALFLIPETYAVSSRRSSIRLAWSGSFRALPALPSFYLILFIFFSVLFAWAFVEPQFMFYAYDDLAWTSAQLGLVMSIFGMACLFSELALGRLSDRLGRKPVLILGLALFSVAFFGLVIFRSPTWLLVCFFLGGLGDGMFDPALSAHILDITPAEHTARIMGLKSTAGSLGNMLGPALIVLITPYVGPRIVFLIAAALVIILTIAAAPALRAPQRKEVTPNYSKAAVTR